MIFRSWYSEVRAENFGARGSTREAAQGALRLLERSKAGHVVEVRLPEEIRGVRVRVTRARDAAPQADATDVEDVNFLKALELRRAARERGTCFYCLRWITPRLECLDHVVPGARVGCNSYRNLVSACMECNSQKGEPPAEEYLRWLFREHRLGAAELRGPLPGAGIAGFGEAAAGAAELREEVKRMRSD